jgi:hypothetical protein
MLQTARDPNGTPKEAFDHIRAAVFGPLAFLKA